MKIFCSGIGGIGLSAYAAYQNAAGHTVLGSDRNDSAFLADLRSQGITVVLQQDGAAVTEDVDLFVYTLALPGDHPELVKARELGIQQMTYFEALGHLMRAEKEEKGMRSICITGTHGKSSTTSMAAKVCIDAGADPSVVLGTKTADLEGRNWRKGSGSLFVVEACEYQRSFHNLSPDIILLTNADGDHFDAYESVEEYQDAFRVFIEQLPADGLLITHMQDPDCAHLAQYSAAAVVDAGEFPLPVLTVPGRHMQENAQLVCALAQHLSLNGATDALHAYKGCWRRMEVKGSTREGALVIDDYGHHPREIRATLAGIRDAHPDKRITCIFQPHTHNRTQKLYDEFTSAFQDADAVIVPNIYDARAQLDTSRVPEEKFASDIQQESEVDTHYTASIQNTILYLKEAKHTEKDILLTMGAGDVWKVADALLTQ